MKQINQLNAGLLVTLGLPKGVAQSLMEYVDELEEGREQWIKRYASLIVANEKELMAMQETLLTMLGQARARIKELETQPPI